MLIETVVSTEKIAHRLQLFPTEHRSGNYSPAAEQIANLKRQPIFSNKLPCLLFGLRYICL